MYRIQGLLWYNAYPGRNWDRTSDRTRSTPMDRTRNRTRGYPLVNIQTTCENVTFIAWIWEVKTHDNCVSEFWEFPFLWVVRVGIVLLTYRCVKAWRHNLCSQSNQSVTLTRKKGWNRNILVSLCGNYNAAPSEYDTVISTSARKHHR